MSIKEEKLLIAISRIRNYLHRDLENIFRSNNLTGTQFSVLEVLKHKGPKCIGEIQKLILGTNGNIPLVIKNLERNGLIIRKKDDNDGRISIIHLTELGNNIIEKSYNQQKNRLKQIFKNIDEKEIEKLSDSIFEMYNKIIEK